MTESEEPEARASGFNYTLIFPGRPHFGHPNSLEMRFQPDCQHCMEALVYAYPPTPVPAPEQQGEPLCARCGIAKSNHQHGQGRGGHAFVEPATPSSEETAAHWHARNRALEKQVVATRQRAEATEAQVAKLREALEHIKKRIDVQGPTGVPLLIEISAHARRALTETVKEGGETQ